MKHDDYPALSFTCQGGPLDKAEYAFPKARYIRGGLTPDIEAVMREGITIATFRRAKGVNVPIVGRYAVAFDVASKTFTATHTPTSRDVYFQAPDSTPVAAAAALPASEKEIQQSAESVTGNAGNGSNLTPEEPPYAQG